MNKGMMDIEHRITALEEQVKSLTKWLYLILASSMGGNGYLILSHLGNI